MATGLVTAALAVAAHGVGGGTAPGGPAVVALGILAVTVGAAAATLARAGQALALMCLLGTGQLLGHLMLSVGHHHAPSSAPPAGMMLAAHVAAIAAGATLIAAGDRLCRAMSRAVRAAIRAAAPTAWVTPVVAMRRADQPLRFRLLLAASVSHRGPPVGFAH